MRYNNYTLVNVTLSREKTELIDFSRISALIASLLCNIQFKRQGLDERYYGILIKILLIIFYKTLIVEQAYKTFLYKTFYRINFKHAKLTQAKRSISQLRRNYSSLHKSL